MDSTTTLITFMLQTSASVRSVELIGSWDNFTKHYTMEKDSRRARGQWRGCYAFDNIIYDGDGSDSPVRNGGLKMGHTYWYYYKIDGDIETYDTSLPSTTACPILPGQPMNLLSVPVEELPLRDRSASVGSQPEPLKTMNPRAKYETPRPPPPTPKLARLNTSTGFECYLGKRPNGLETPKSCRLPWSPRALFGPKFPGSTNPSYNLRDRGLHSTEGDSNISHPVLISRTDEGRKCVSLQDMRQQQQNSAPQTPNRRTSLPKLDITILDVDDDDDANFASNFGQKHDRDSQLPPTVLSPPPSRLGSLKNHSSEHIPTLRLLTANSTSEDDITSKPLPSIPNTEDDAFSFTSMSSFRPAPLRLSSSENQLQVQHNDLHTQTNNSNWAPRSHFSVDSLDEMVLELSDDYHTDSPRSTQSFLDHDDLSIGMISPSDSPYSTSCASPASLLDYEFDDTIPSDFNLFDIAAEDQARAAVSPIHSEFQYNPMIAEVSSRGFQGYSLPDASEYGSEHTLKREVTASSDATQIRSARTTFGGTLSAELDVSETLTSSLEGLLAELGYLGEAINN